MNKTRLKNALLDRFKESDGETLIIFRGGMSILLKEALKKGDFSNDTKILAKDANVVGKDIFCS